MAKLEDRGQRGLPPPPAPPRRGANPWKLSDTARKREAPPPREEETASQLLGELLAGQPHETAPPEPVPKEQAPAREPASRRMSRRRLGFLPLLVLLLIAGVIAKIALGARETGEWRELIPALFILFFIAHSWWRSRRRREAKGQEEET
jgi:hypothetical protein